MKKSAIIFHPAIAPYRIDFFNSLNERFNAFFYFEFNNALEQSFNQDQLIDRLSFKPNYLKRGFAGIKNLRLEVISILWKAKPNIVFISEYNLLGLLVCFYKLFCQWNLRIVTICDDNFYMAQTATKKKRLTRFVMLHVLSIVIIADKKALHWYQENLSYRANYIYLPIIQSDTLFRNRLEQAIPLANELCRSLNLIGKKTVLYVGRLASVKNISLLIEAFKRIYEKDHSVRLLIVGEGDLRKELEEQAQPYLSEKTILFVGKKEGLELLAYYNLGQVFVLPSTYEPFGTVVNEALLAGCYTLCSSKAGATSLIEEPMNGNLFDPISLTDLTHKLSKALSICNKLTNIELKSNHMLIKYEEQMEEFLEKLAPSSF